MRRRTVVITASVLVVVLGVGGGLWARHAWTTRCGAGSAFVDADDAFPGFVPADELDLPAWVDELPFGTPVSGYEAEPDDSSDPPRMLDGGAGAYVASGTGFADLPFAGTLSAVDLPDGDVRWARGFDGGAPGGGTVGDVFVTGSIPEDGAPEVAAFDAATGKQVSCTRLGTAEETGYGDGLQTGQLDGDVIVGYDADHLTRIDPATGEQAWTVPADEAGLRELDVAPGLVAVGRYRNGGAGNAMVNALINPDVPSLHLSSIAAYSSDDGAHLWTYPTDQPDDEWTTASLIGVDEGSGTVLLDTSHGRYVDGPPTGPVGDDDYVADRAVVALDADGSEVWHHDLPISSDPGTATPELALWGDTVVVPVNDPAAKDTTTIGLAVADGATLWTIGSSLGFLDNAWQLGDLWVVQDGSDLTVVDPTTGEADRTELSVPGPVYDLTTTDEHVLLTWEHGVLVYDRTDG